MQPDPAEFRYVGSYYCGSSVDVPAECTDPEAFDTAASVERHPDAHNVRITDNWYPFNGRCDHCGAHHAWGSVFIHTPTGTCVCVGHICASEIFSLPNRAALLKRRGEKALARAAAQRKAVKDARAFAVAKGIPQLECGQYSHRILADMWGKLVKWGSLSDKQVAFAGRLIAEQLNPKPTPDKPTEPEPTSEAPTGRMDVVGQILGIKVKDDPVYGEVTKMLVRSVDGGWKVWCTLPASLSEANKGDMVRFTVTLKQSPKDRFFAYGSRPSKGKVIKATAPEERDLAEEVDAEASDARSRKLWQEAEAWDYVTGN